MAVKLLIAVELRAMMWVPLFCAVNVLLLLVNKESALTYDRAE